MSTSTHPVLRADSVLREEARRLDICGIFKPVGSFSFCLVYDRSRRATKFLSREEWEMLENL